MCTSTTHKHPLCATVSAAPQHAHTRSILHHSTTDHFALQRRQCPPACDRDARWERKMALKCCADNDSGAALERRRAEEHTCTGASVERFKPNYCVRLKSDIEIYFWWQCQQPAITDPCVTGYLYTPLTPRLVPWGRPAARALSRHGARPDFGVRLLYGRRINSNFKRW